MKYEMFYQIKKTSKSKELLSGKEDIINKKMKEMQEISSEEYISWYNKVEDIFKKENKDLYVSHEKYIDSCKKNFDNMLVESGEKYEHD